MSSNPRLSDVQGGVTVQQVDLSDLASVRAAAEALRKLERIDYIILNAGVMVSVMLSHCRARLERRN